MFIQWSYNTIGNKAFFRANINQPGHLPNTVTKKKQCHDKQNTTLKTQNPQKEPYIAAYSGNSGIPNVNKTCVYHTTVMRSIRQTE